MIKQSLAVPVMCGLMVCSTWAEALFNGKDFQGWTFESIDPKTTPEQVWSISEGILICKGRPPGLMRTEKDYANYELTLEWRWAPGGKPGNSGVLVHASDKRELFAWPKSIEVQLGNANAGDFWTVGETISVAGGEPEGRRWVKRSTTAEKAPGEWNRLKVRCEGREITVWVNDVLMNEGVGSSAERGAICLQSEDREVHFRNIGLVPIAESQAR